MRRLIDRIPLQRGSHPTRDDGMCAMEMVSWLAGEAHSDEPECACPVLAALVRACNDAMSDQQRAEHLRPLVPMLVNSRGSVATETRRGLMALDVMVRGLLPRALERRGRAEEARLLRSLPVVRDLSGASAARSAVAAFVRDQRAASWVLDRAVEGAPAQRYVAGVVQVARALGDRAAWTELTELVAQMVGAQAPVTLQAQPVQAR